MARWTVERARWLDGYHVERASPERLIVSDRNRLYVTSGEQGEMTLLGTVPARWFYSAAAWFRPAQRLLRFNFYNVVERTDGDFFISFATGVSLLRGGVAVPLQGLLRPTRILRNACAVNDQGDLFFGEYLPNPDHGPVHIYRLPAGSTQLEIAHRFEPGEIRHVHGIYRDPHDSSLWCLTGDRPEECRMLRSSDGFRTLETVGSGDETWRAVSAVFTPAAIYYGTDAEFNENYLYRLDRATGAREILATVDGPVYYSTKSGDDLFFAVTAELSPSQRERAAVLWHVGPDDVVASLATFRKDRLPTPLFQPGTINFAGGSGANGEVYFHGVGLTGAEARPHCLRRVETNRVADVRR
jgi:hypothetical protein